MVLILPGKFGMGYEDNKKVVEIPHYFWIQKTEVTQLRWSSITGKKTGSLGLVQIEEMNIPPLQFLGTIFIKNFG